MLKSFLSGVAALAALSIASPSLAQNKIDAPANGASPVVDLVRSAGVLKVGVIVNAPFILQDPVNNTYTGPAADFIKAAADGIGAKIEWVPVNWDTMIAGLQAKQYQILATAVYATEARKSVVDFVNYSKSGVCYVARKTNTKVNALNDIVANDLSIVIPSGASFAGNLKSTYPKLTVETKQLPPGGGNFYEDVLTERYDLTTIESLIAPQVVSAQPDLKVIPSVNECVAKPDFPIDVGIAINKGDAEFEKYLNTVVKAAAPAVDAAIKTVK